MPSLVRTFVPITPSPSKLDPQLDRILWPLVNNPGIAHGAAARWAACKHAFDAVHAAAPEAFRAPGLANPLGVLDDAVSDLSTLSWMGGVRAGAAYKHLRLALMAIQPVRVCYCTGHGCPECNGTGTLASTPPELGFFADD